MKTLTLFLILAASASAQVVINGATASLGGFTIGAGGCFTGTATVTGATVTGMTATASPRTFPGNGITWNAYISASNVATVKVCNSISGFVGVSIYDVNVLTGSGGGSGSVTAVTASLPVTSSGGATPNIACPTCSVVAGARLATDFVYSSTTPTPIPGMTFNVVAGKSYSITIWISDAPDITSGGNYQLACTCTLDNTGAAYYYAFNEVTPFATLIASARRTGATTTQLASYTGTTAVLDTFSAQLNVTVSGVLTVNVSTVTGSNSGSILSGAYATLTQF